MTLSNPCNSTLPSCRQQCTGPLQTHLQILKQIVHARLDVEAIEPERKHARLALALGVKVFNLWHVDLFERREPGVVVEQVGDERQVELGVTSDERVGREEFPAPEFRRVLEYLLGALVQVLCLERGERAIRRQLVQQHSVIFAVLDVVGKVGHPGHQRRLAFSRVALTFSGGLPPSNDS
jgi:hypothetical protein